MMSNIEKLYDIYDDVKDDLKFLIKSDVRLKILISLTDEAKNITQLNRELNLSSSTILHGMYQLERKNLISRESGSYSLSKTGHIYRDKVMDMVKSTSALDNCKNILLRHEINCIPKELLKEWGSLENSRIIKSITTDILRPHRALFRYLYPANNLKHISSIYYAPIIKSVYIQDKGDVHLLLTREVMDKMIGEADQDVLENLLSKGNLELGVIKDDTQIFFTLGDDFMALGLYFLNGEYDLSNILVSESKDAISWGERLFSYYQERATDFYELNNP